MNSKSWWRWCNLQHCQLAFLKGKEEWRKQNHSRQQASWACVVTRSIDDTRIVTTLYIIWTRLSLRTAVMPADAHQPYCYVEPWERIDPDDGNLWYSPCGNLFGKDCNFILDKTRKVHTTNSTKAIPEEHWKNPDAGKQMEDCNEAILVKIWDDMKPERVVLKLKRNKIQGETGWRRQE